MLISKTTLVPTWSLLHLLSMEACDQGDRLCAWVLVPILQAHALLHLHLWVYVHLSKIHIPNFIPTSIKYSSFQTFWFGNNPCFTSINSKISSSKRIWVCLVDSSVSIAQYKASKLNLGANLFFAIHMFLLVFSVSA